MLDAGLLATDASRRLFPHSQDAKDQMFPAPEVSDKGEYFRLESELAAFGSSTVLDAYNEWRAARLDLHMLVAGIAEDEQRGLPTDVEERKQARSARERLEVATNAVKQLVATELQQATSKE